MSNSLDKLKAAVEAAKENANEIDVEKRKIDEQYRTARRVVAKATAALRLEEYRLADPDTQDRKREVALHSYALIHRADITQQRDYHCLCCGTYKIWVHVSTGQVFKNGIKASVFHIVEAAAYADFGIRV